MSAVSSIISSSHGGGAFDNIGCRLFYVNICGGLSNHAICRGCIGGCINQQQLKSICLTVSTTDNLSMVHSRYRVFSTSIDCKEFGGGSGGYSSAVLASAIGVTEHLSIGSVCRVFGGSIGGSGSCGDFPRTH